jgi:hypothetical protein
LIPAAENILISKSYECTWKYVIIERMTNDRKEYRKAHHEKNKEKDNANSRAYYQAHKEKTKTDHAVWYLLNKEDADAKHKAYRESHREEELEHNREYRRRLKVEVLKHYGGQCTCCGETELSFLNLDHINGGGNEHRRQIGGGGSINFYMWVRSHGFPTDLQILCANCNLSKRLLGQCAHKGKNEN